MNLEIKLNKELKKYLFLLNQIFEMEKKVEKLQEKNSIQRNLNKLKSFFEEEFIEGVSLMIENPINQKYDETRTDVEAMIAGESAENLVIVDVIKPIIRIKQNNRIQIIQKGVVIVEDINSLQKQEAKKSQNSSSQNVKSMGAKKKYITKSKKKQKD